MVATGVQPHPQARCRTVRASHSGDAECTVSPGAVATADSTRLLNELNSARNYAKITALLRKYRAQKR
ncbi:hypothetical protein Van01_63240 [Micromonospora andamanensis]|uniref:Uncharacterized protein n=1 Tax=Micromonospora andamanensis TaxID=1287068 RepID=A0ABQ4I5E1_9ACTN|nr:hypothetical protein Van01_63240 [Micromonospora andamanensis]